MPRVFKRAAARRDLVEHYAYLAENAGEASQIDFSPVRSELRLLKANTPKWAPR